MGHAGRCLIALSLLVLPYRYRYNRYQWRIRLVGLGHLPLKEEIGGSNPPCATKSVLR